MNRQTVLFGLGALVVCASSFLFAQDVTKVAANHYQVLFENQYVRVLKCSMPPGATPLSWILVEVKGAKHKAVPVKQ